MSHCVYSHQQSPSWEDNIRLPGKNIAYFCVKCSLITICKRIGNRILSWTRLIQSTFSYSVSLRSNWILSSRIFSFMHFFFYMHAYMRRPEDPCRYSDWLHVEHFAVRYLVGKAFFSSPHTFRPSLETIQPRVLVYNGHWGSMPGLLRPGHKVGDQPPSSAEVKNEWSCTSSPDPLPSWHVTGRPLLLHV